MKWTVSLLFIWLSLSREARRRKKCRKGESCELVKQLKKEACQRKKAIQNAKEETTTKRHAIRTEKAELYRLIQPLFSCLIGYIWDKQTHSSIRQHKIVLVNQSRAADYHQADTRVMENTHSKLYIALEFIFSLKERKKCENPHHIAL